MYRKLSAFALVTIGLSLTACSSAEPIQPAVSTTPSEEVAVVDTANADSEAAAMNRATYSIRQDLQQALVDYDDDRCTWTTDGYVTGSDRALRCSTYFFTIPTNAKTMGLQLTSATEDGVPAGYEDMVEDTFAALDGLAAFDGVDDDDTGFRMAKREAESALSVWETLG